MKYLTLLLAFTTSAFINHNLNAQCTPTDCSASLPNYGGICDSSIANAVVNQSYDDFESFHTTTACFDIGVFIPAFAGTYARIDQVHSFSFSGLPNGVSGGTNMPTYTSPANGCFSFSGTPTEIGVFAVSADFLADVTVTNSACTPFFTQSNNDISFPLQFIVLPDPSFTIPATDFCIDDASVNLTITGTSGGTFSGPGVSGTTFDPAVAGSGAHTIWYVVSAQEGAAVEAASDSSFVLVNVSDPTIDAGIDAEICVGNSVTLTATNAGCTPSWDNSVANGVAFEPPLGSNDYTVTCTIGSCTDTDDINITVHDTATINGVVTDENTGNDGSIDITATEGNSPYTYDWGAHGTSEDLSGLAAGDYTVTVTTANNCTSSKTFTVDVLASNLPIEDMNLKIYPNPASDVINISGDLLGNYNVKIINIHGQIVLSTDTKFVDDVAELNVSSIETGTYQLILTEADSGDEYVLSLIVE